MSKLGPNEDEIIMKDFLTTILDQAIRHINRMPMSIKYDEVRKDIKQAIMDLIAKLEKVELED